MHLAIDRARRSRVALTATLPLHARRLLLTTAVFALLDVLWLSVFMGEFYKQHLGDLARRHGPDFAPLWWAAALVYVVLVVGLVSFVLPKGQSPSGALGWGVLFGVVAYGTYDLTCQAVIRDWPVLMTGVDIAWGATICGLTSWVVRGSECHGPWAIHVPPHPGRLSQ